MPKEPKIGATADSYIYRIRLPQQLKNEWFAYCKKKNKRASSTLRALMRYMIKDEMPDNPSQTFQQELGLADARKKIRIEVRLTQSEYDAINIRAKDEGCSMQRWIINSTRASLLSEPQFTLKTAQAVWESNYQLKAIGKNLNQIAKKLHESGILQLDDQGIDNLTQIIKKHTDKVSTLTDASLSRWIIK